VRSLVADVGRHHARPWLSANRCRPELNPPSRRQHSSSQCQAGCPAAQLQSVWWDWSRPGTSPGALHGCRHFCLPRDWGHQLRQGHDQQLLYFFGVPVAPLGLLYFTAVTLVCLPAAWRSPRPFLGALRLGSVTAGVLLVLYLIWAELFRINAICLWCTAGHILTIALFTIVIIARALSGPPRTHQP